ncbi:MAG: hypothetical protein HZA61_02970 [Candidatus Eisenbacteria bacterium]|uniref:Uncharacterized protein n=1 Tax=Eiseniibacteriota bacterium TaxID=2212470 RepID=A0A933SDG3_UNCEI|nr:hypothetical protein [Candidatus Eisenbacteria bacterium]
MRRLGFSLLLLALLSGPAHAQYGAVRIAWDDCGSAGATARTFACNTNSGVEVIVVSFKPANSTDAVYQFDTRLALGYESFEVIPDWWAFVPVTGCRRGSLIASADFTSASGACADPWMGQAFTSLSVTRYDIFDTQLRREIVQVTTAIPFASAAPLDAATEYYGVRLIVNHQKTVGTGACAGCAQGMCVGLFGSGSSTLANPANPVRSSLFPRNGYSVTWNGGTSCDRLVPARNATWGALKSLYR